MANKKKRQGLKKRVFADRIDPGLVPFKLEKTGVEIVDHENLADLFSRLSMQASSARFHIADYVLWTEDHPTAEDVQRIVGKQLKSLSLATVYNTLNAFVDRGLLREVRISGDNNVHYDPNLDHHFHLLDEETGRIIDLEADLLEPTEKFNQCAKEFEITHLEVVLRGRKLPSKKKKLQQPSTSLDNKS